MTKIGFVITNHQSESIRPQGRDLLHKCVHSLYHSCDHPFELYVVDNGSEKKLDNTSSVKNHHHIIIEDQSIGGLTYAWNVGIKAAYDDGCDLIFNLNDDLTINSTINDMIKIILDHDHNDVSIYGPLTNGDGGNHDRLQTRNPLVAGEGLVETTIIDGGWMDMVGYPLNGFFYAFTRDVVEKFSNEKQYLFSEDIRDAWGSQERELFLREQPNGLRMFIVEPCIIHHTKLRHWKKARTEYKHPRRTLEDRTDYVH